MMSVSSTWSDVPAKTFCRSSTSPDAAVHGCAGDNSPCFSPLIHTDNRWVVSRTRMKRIITSYARLMQSHPIKTQIVTAASVMLTGDLIAQKLIERRKTIDVGRASGFFLLGITFSGPTLAAWYIALDRWLVRSIGPSATLKKMLLDQLVGTPIYLLCFLGVRGAMQGHSWSEIKETVRTRYVNILATSYVIWPAAMAINFHYVPLNYRLLFTGTVGLVWGTCLSYKLNSVKRAVRVKVGDTSDLNASSSECSRLT